MSRTARLLLGGFALLVVALLAAGFWYVRRDSADPAASVAAVGGPAGSAAGDGRASADGTWKVAPGANVFAGYRVHETLLGNAKEATGRTPQVEGTMTVQGATIPAATVTADLTKLASDDPRRDRAIGGMGIETAKFPTATFTLTQPIALPVAPARGAEVAVTAQGELTLHGQTRAVTVPLTARWDGDQIAVATRDQGVRLDFKDYGFDALSVPIARTDDFGFLELQLRFVPA